MSDPERTVLVDASTFITLAEIRACDLLYGVQGRLVVPAAVRREVIENPAEGELDRAVEAGDVSVRGPTADGDPTPSSYRRAAEHLDRPWTVDGTDPASDDAPSGSDESGETAHDERHWSGDVALLGQALELSDAVVVTDDNPLRETCKALSIPVSGSIGVLVRAVERGDVDADEATGKLLAMDEVGARLSARLLRRAERLIEDADASS